MPNYKYGCQNQDCGIEFDIQQSITSSPLRFCESCKTEQLERVIHLPMAFVRGEPKTVGHLAHRNTESLSSMQLSERSEIAKANEPPKSPDLAKLRKLGNLNEVQKKKYIETGKLP